VRDLVKHEKNPSRYLVWWEISGTRNLAPVSEQCHRGFGPKEVHAGSPQDRQTGMLADEVRSIFSKSRPLMKQFIGGKFQNIGMQRTK
jgi:hypothetical protein